MTKQQQLLSDIKDIEEGLDSTTTDERFKASLRDILKSKKDELASLGESKPAEKKAPAPAKAPAKESVKESAKQSAPSSAKNPKDVLANCREILAKHNKEKAKASKRVEARRKAGKPATLTPSETVSKTAKAVESKVVQMKGKTDKGLPASEVNKLASGIISTIKNTLKGIVGTSAKHEFLSHIKSEINSIDTGLGKVAMDGGMFAQGGMMAKGGSLDSIKRKYEQNEDENAHSENVVLLAKHFGDVNDLKEAKEILSKHNKDGHLSSENGKKRQELHLKLIAKARKEMNKEGIEFADGGMFEDGGTLDLFGEIGSLQNIGGTSFSNADLTSHLDIQSPMFAKGGNTGRAWTLDHYQHNKGESYEVPASQRKYAEGGLADFYEKKKYSYKEGGDIADSNTEMLMSKVTELRHHADEIESIVNRDTKVEAWVVAKAERSATDMSDITHYLDGRKDMFGHGGYMEKGGVVKWQDVNVGDSANVKAENKTGIVFHTYGRKFNLRFVDGTEKTYDASELEFISNDDDNELFANGGEVNFKKIKRIGQEDKYGFAYIVRESGDNYVIVQDEKIGHWKQASPIDRVTYYEELLPKDEVDNEFEYLAHGGETGMNDNRENAKQKSIDDTKRAIAYFESVGDERQVARLKNYLKEYLHDTSGYAHGGTLKGNQYKLDINKNGRLDKQDFMMLRGDKMAHGGETDSEKKNLKDIISKDYVQFVHLLGENIKDPKFRKTVIELSKENKVKYKVIEVECDNLRPTQNEISLDKSLAFPLTSPHDAERYLNPKEAIKIKGNTILTCDNGKYIIDGHHRWSQVFVLNPKAKMLCTDFYELKEPLAGLKATQLGISADLGYLPTAHVNDINLLTVSESSLKKYVNDKITDEVREVFKKNGINNPAEHIWKNVVLLKTKNKPVKNASKRDYMPQTDVAKDFTEYTPNISKMAKGGATFNDKIKSISKSLLKRKKVSPKVQKDYGKTYDKKEAIESAKRIAGSMRKNEMTKKKRIINKTETVSNVDLTDFDKDGDMVVDNA